MKDTIYTDDDIEILNSKKGLEGLLSEKEYNPEKTIRYVGYEKKLKKLQIELIRLQTWVIKNDERIIERSPPHEGPRRHFHRSALDQLRHLLHIHHVAKRVIERTHIGIDLFRKITWKEA